MPPEPRQTVVVDGLALATEIRQRLADAVARQVAAGCRPPCLAVVLVGNDPASASYIKGKQRACGRVGMDSVEHRLPDSASETEVIEVVDRLNRDAGVDGILVQLPLPKGVRPTAVAEAVDPTKDVDGLHPMNAGYLLLGQPGLVPCTPLGIMKILEHHAIPLEGAHAVVIGRSAIVGKPIALLLQRANATVTMCHSRTRDLAGVCREADILVAAVGVPRLVKADWIQPGAAVIDVGVSEVNGALVGDVDTESAVGIASIVTPHRRGVGPMTITMLLQNTLDAYRRRGAGGRSGALTSDDDASARS
ncbi:MAG: bifunctional methylenetetrahydrofolate dehydrogenase/methenyltetrahydrofolate cyclohydrolase FolD [Myxococcales bacterium]|nr:bifunctional methylenetetrahydrofolate dehydrogenase/methenyltetrahydrofolate cyclohydrolase FolD [Myxococcales bacterium]